MTKRIWFPSERLGWSKRWIRLTQRRGSSFQVMHPDVLKNQLYHSGTFWAKTGRNDPFGDKMAGLEFRRWEMCSFVSSERKRDSIRGSVCSFLPVSLPSKNSGFWKISFSVFHPGRTQNHGGQAEVLSIPKIPASARSRRICGDQWKYLHRLWKREKRLLPICTDTADRPPAESADRSAFGWLQFVSLRAGESLESPAGELPLDPKWVCPSAFHKASLRKAMGAGKGENDQKNVGAVSKPFENKRIKERRGQVQAQPRRSFYFFKYSSSVCSSPSFFSCVHASFCRSWETASAWTTATCFCNSRLPFSVLGKWRIRFNGSLPPGCFKIEILTGKALSAMLAWRENLSIHRATPPFPALHEKIKTSRN